MRISGQNERRIVCSPFHIIHLVDEAQFSVAHAETLQTTEQTVGLSFRVCQLCEHFFQVDTGLNILRACIICQRQFDAGSGAADNGCFHADEFNILQCDNALHERAHAKINTHFRNQDHGGPCSVEQFRSQDT